MSVRLKCFNSAIVSPYADGDRCESSICVKYLSLLVRRSAGVNPVSSASSANINNAGTFATYGGTRTLSGGTMDATTAEMGVYLKNSTTLTATGACRYQIVEFA